MSVSKYAPGILQFFEPILEIINDMVNLDIYKTRVNVRIIISLFVNVVHHLTKVEYLLFLKANKKIAV